VTTPPDADWSTDRLIKCFAKVIYSRLLFSALFSVLFELNLFIGAANECFMVNFKKKMCQLLLWKLLS